MHKHDDRFEKEHIQRLLDGNDVKPSMYINDIGRIFNKTVFRATDRVDMSHGYRHILFHLSHQDGLTQLELAKMTHLTAPSVSVALSKMEKDGLVKRKADEHDMRKIRVYLTEKGKEHNDFVWNKCQETEEKMLEGVTAQEQEELCRIMRKLLVNLLNNE